MWSLNTIITNKVLVGFDKEHKFLGAAVANKIKFEIYSAMKMWIAVF
jgi:hypothetical protein